MTSVLVAKQKFNQMFSDMIASYNCDDELRLRLIERVEKSIDEVSDSEFVAFVDNVMKSFEKYRAAVGDLK